MRVVSWLEFNSAVQYISSYLRERELSGVYGFPRGGICLAVALSHNLQIPFLSEPQSGCLIVDDIYETGKTINTIKDIPNILTFVWFSKQPPTWWITVETLSSNEWIVFPWENAEFATRDKDDYLSRRQLK